MPIADYRPGEISDLGEKIYREKLKSLVYPAEKGKFLIIDVESGDYEIDEDALTATQRLRQRRPKAVNYGVKVGYKAVFHFGGRQSLDDD